jgi:AraC family transcriptional regulator
MASDVPCMDEMAFRVWRSSRDRCWRGFEAYIYDASDGHSDEYFAEHYVCMHVSAPVQATSKCDGERVQRVQVAGDLKIVPAGHSRIWETAAPSRKLAVFLMPWFVREAASDMQIDPDRVRIVPKMHANDARMEHIGWALMEELQSAEPMGRLFAESLGYALALQLLRRNSRAIEPRTRTLPKRRLERVFEYIRSQPERDLSLAELANVAAVSVSTLKSGFKESTGTSVHQYVIGVRVERALELLLGTDAAIADVALQCGFAGQSHLTHHLRRLRGMTPAQVRREGR